MKKAVCIVASKNAVIDGDVGFSRGDLSRHGPSYMLYCPNGYYPHFTERGYHFFSKMPLRHGLKLNLLWIWHMLILRKKYVYLTGVMRKPITVKWPA